MYFFLDFCKGILINQFDFLFGNRSILFVEVWLVQ